jgi:hypothetical protein
MACAFFCPTQPPASNGEVLAALQAAGLHSEYFIIVSMWRALLFRHFQHTGTDAGGDTAQTVIARSRN